MLTIRTASTWRRGHCARHNLPPALGTTHTHQNVLFALDVSERHSVYFRCPTSGSGAAALTTHDGLEASPQHQPRVPCHRSIQQSVSRWKRQWISPSKLVDCPSDRRCPWYVTGSRPNPILDSFCTQAQSLCPSLSQAQTHTTLSLSLCLS